MQHYPSPPRKCVKLSHELSILVAPWCGSLTHSDPVSVSFAWCERIFVCALKCCRDLCGAVQRAPQSPVQGHIHTFSRTEGGHSRQLEAHAGCAEEGGFSRYSSWLSNCDLYNEALLGKMLLIIGLSIWSLSLEDPLEKGVASHFNILIWKFPWTEEPGRLQSIGSVTKSWTWLSDFHFYY